MHSHSFYLTLPMHITLTQNINNKSTTPQFYVQLHVLIFNTQAVSLQMHPRDFAQHKINAIGVEIILTNVDKG